MSRALNIVIQNKEDRRQYVNDELKFKHPNISRLKRREFLKSQKNKCKNSDQKIFNDNIEILNRKIKEGFDKERTGILCVTDNSEKIGMWKEYIPNGEGVCIKLDGWIIIKHLHNIPISRSKIDSHLCFFRPVDYIDKPLQISYREFVICDPGKVGITLLYSKLKDKDFEQEYRFVIHECIDQSIQFPSEIVKEVIAGPNNTNDQMELLKLWTNSRSSRFIVNNNNGY